VREQRIGVVLDSLREVRAGSDTLLADLPAWRARVRRIDNRAVFEIPQILEQLLHTSALPRSISALLEPAMP
jgi:1,2-diacylglycerol 3-beta-galactosyltransferase